MDSPNPPNDLQALGEEFGSQAQQTNQRRLVLLHGEAQATHEAAAILLEAAGIPSEEVVLVGADSSQQLPAEAVSLDRSRQLMGTTHEALILDAHASMDPDVLGRTIGAVDGGGLYLLLAPSLATWPRQRDGFDAHLAVPPFEIDEVAGRFRTRLIDTLRGAPGIAIATIGEDASSAKIEQVPADTPSAGKASTDQVETTSGSDPTASPALASFPEVVYEACRTQDQADTVHALETLLDPGQIVVVESDRGRGKSSAAGLAAGGLLDRGADVLLTAPRPENVGEVFARARELASHFGHDELTEQTDKRLVFPTGGRLVYQDAQQALALVQGASQAGKTRQEAPGPAVARPTGGPDAIIVDEAAGLPVHVLEGLIEGQVPIAFASTVHGYEGAGRGFSVRLAEHLEAIDRPVRRIQMDQPIRYAEDDPVEAWSFDALMLDASPASSEEIPAHPPEQAYYLAPTADELLANESLLHEAFGLLVFAHYRTRPSDLARILDAPNISLRCLVLDDHVVSVALLAREGALPASLRERMYEGERVPGNMIPDVLTSQLRDEQAAGPVGWRILRIATHPELRREGFATRLVEETEHEAKQRGESAHGEPDHAPDGGDGQRADGGGDGEGANEDTDADPTGASSLDWLGTSYGATPGLVPFWDQLDFRTVHLATRKHPASGEHSAIQVKALTERGQDLVDRSEHWFIHRIPSVLADALDELDPDVARAALASVEQPPPLELSDREWRLVASAAYGTGVYDTGPRPFRRLAMHYLVDQRVELDPDQERLLVCKVLQARSWDHIVEELGYVSKRMAMRALGEAFQPLVDAYGGEVARGEAERYR